MKTKTKKNGLKKSPAKVRDLTAKKNPKGGVRKAGGAQQEALTLNHNENLVCDQAS